MHPYLEPPLPHVLAHRGLTFVNGAPTLDENTLAAFKNAVAAGATHVETDLQVTKDGVAVLFHDDTLDRVAGIGARVSELTFVELRKVRLLHGGQVPSLLEVLEALPDTKWNIDFKTPDCVEPACGDILRANSSERVLIASFSDANRRRAQRFLPAAAASAGIALSLLIVISIRLKLSWFARLLSRKVQALQLPREVSGVRLDSRKLIAGFRSLGLAVHYWTVNDPAEMSQLVGLGASGIVTDRADLAAASLRHL